MGNEDENGVVQKNSDDSILLTIKKLLGIHPDETAFDSEIITNINTAISVFTDLGVGPDNGYAITDKETTWEDYFGEDFQRFQEIKNAIYYRVRLIFDPPSASSAVSAMENGLAELEWRMMNKAEILKRKNGDEEVS